MTEEDWEEVTKLANEYYVEHSKLINRLINRLSHPEDAQPYLVEKISEMNSPYGRSDDV